MMYAVTIEFSGTSAQWHITAPRPGSGKDYTNYTLEADSFEDAEAKARAMYEVRSKKERADEVSMYSLFAGDNKPALMLISQKEPREHRLIAWTS